MIGQIGYLGKVSPRTGIASALLYTAGAALGSAVVGMVLGAVGLTVRWLLGLRADGGASGVLIAVAALAVVGGLRDLGFVQFPLMEPWKQVPRSWLQVFGPYKTSFLWGLGIGLAYTTVIQYTPYYVLAFWVLLTGNPLLGALALALYGTVQGLLITVDVTAMSCGGGGPDGWMGSRRSGVFFPLSGAALLACAVLLLAQAGVLRLGAG